MLKLAFEGETALLRAHKDSI